MPIEIKEMNIRIVVGESSATPSPTNAEDTDSNEQTIEACVEQIMEILSNKDER